VQQQAREELRAQVLQETLARLLQQKTVGSAAGNAMVTGGNVAAGTGPALVPPPGETGDFSADCGFDDSHLPDWQRGLGAKEQANLAPKKSQATGATPGQGEGPWILLFASLVLMSLLLGVYELCKTTRSLSLLNRVRVGSAMHAILLLS